MYYTIRSPYLNMVYLKTGGWFLGKTETRISEQVGRNITSFLKSAKLDNFQQLSSDAANSFRDGGTPIEPLSSDDIFKRYKNDETSKNAVPYFQDFAMDEEGHVTRCLLPPDLIEAMQNHERNKTIYGID